MSEYELWLTVDKPRKLRELWRARARVRQLERQLRGELRMTALAPESPEFLMRVSRTAYRRSSEHASGPVVVSGDSVDLDSRPGN